MRAVVSAPVQAPLPSHGSSFSHQRHQHSAAARLDKRGTICWNRAPTLSGADLWLGGMMSGFALIIQPDAEDDEAAEILVDGTIEGRGYRFLLDTGAARTSVQDDEYTSTFDTVEQNESAGVFEKSRSDVITVPSIALGPISKTSFTLVRMAQSRSGVRNLIGMDLLKDYCCHFLFDEQRVAIDPTDTSARDYTSHELLLGNRFHPYVDVRVGEANARTVWDTGAGITVVDLGFIQRHPTLFREVGKSQGTDSAGAQMETPMFIMARPLIGNHMFPPHKVAGVDLSHVNASTDIPMDMILGFSTLSKANWLFDFPRRRWAISKLLG
jgi:hypothetical protein